MDKCNHDCFQCAFDDCICDDKAWTNEKVEDENLLNHNAYMHRLWSRNNRDKVKLHHRTYYIKNKEICNKKARKYYQEHKEELNQKRRENKRKYYQEHKEEMRQKQRDYRQRVAARKLAEEQANARV